VSVKDTSIKAYQEIIEDGVLGNGQIEVYKTLIEEPDLTDCEISNLLGYKDPNKIRPRRKELLDLGLIQSSGKRECSITGKTAYQWEPKENPDLVYVKSMKDRMTKKICCPMCQGKGYIERTQTTLEGYNGKTNN